MDAALIVFDLTDMDSFKSVKFWYKDLMLNSPRSIITFLVGNKTDLKISKNETHEN